ncbi:RHS repeat-associated core domain-containing protein [Pseudomonas caspiana]|uniref:RHS repeat domain-containing protein n=1 Tax=Pseudomonas caspiana TaxID=1451454 RepID=UPI0032EB455B
MSLTLHAHTPSIATMDSRSLTVGSIAYCRINERDEPELRVTRQSFDPAGRLIASQDPRLPMPNQQSVYSLSGQVLLTDSVDAGWRVALLGDAGQLLEGWDGRDGQRQIDYDELMRPVLIGETSADSVEARLARESVTVSTQIKHAPLQQHQVVERFTYGGPELAEHNQCNQLIRHDDTAGTVHRPDCGLLGSPITEIRQFLREPEMPDWPLAVAERDILLESNGLESTWVFNALGEAIEQTDAMDNTRYFKHTVAGQLKSVSLGELVLLSEIRYNAFDQVEQHTSGNGVISCSTYDPQDGRLKELCSALGTEAPLQLLKYRYDPVGNIEQIEDAAQPVRFFANQRIEPINRYRYDTLYQLIEATGREVKTGASHGPALPDLQNLPPDPGQLANYTQNYEYDAGGNLLEMRHVGAQLFTRTMEVAPHSNRSLPADEVDVDFENGFDANGNLLQLVRGQDLSWDARNQLRQITTVRRDDGPSDIETYIYDGGGQRCRKISSAQTQSRTLITEVRYLPGLEIRSNVDGEVLHVVTVGDVRMLHWHAGKRRDVANNQLRYSLSDHLGSTTLELDDQGGVVSQEMYYPFGGTAWWAASSAVQAQYKTVRYSGKERDASGLYYYGFRYYAPWLQRWINPDPAGDVDGLNLYRFSKNTPVLMVDTSGAQPFDFNEVVREESKSGNPVKGIGLKAIAARNPNFGGTLAVALTASKAGVAFALKTINLIRSGFAKPSGREALLTYFRNPSESNATTDELIISMTSRALSQLNATLQNYASEKIIGVGGDRGSKKVAWHYLDDPQQRVFMRESVFHESANNASWNIIHELSHATLKTQDIWYINTPSATPAGAAGGASYAGRIEAYVHMQKLQMRRPGYMWAGEDEQRLDSESFAADPLKRSKTILSNADSVSMLTSFINQTFNGPLARLTLIKPKTSNLAALHLAGETRLAGHHQRRMSL